MGPRQSQWREKSRVRRQTVHAEIDLQATREIGTKQNGQTRPDQTDQTELRGSVRVEGDDAILYVQNSRQKHHRGGRERRERRENSRIFSVIHTVLYLTHQWRANAGTRRTLLCFLLVLVLYPAYESRASVCVFLDEKFIATNTLSPFYSTHAHLAFPTRPSKWGPPPVVASHSLSLASTLSAINNFPRLPFLRRLPSFFSSSPPRSYTHVHVNTIDSFHAPSTPSLRLKFRSFLRLFN